MPRTVSASEAKNRLGSIMDWVLKSRDQVIVEVRGEPTVVIMSVDEYEEMRSLQEQARRAAALESLRSLRRRVMARSQDLTPQEGEELAERFSHEVVEDLAEEGRIRFEP